MRTVFKNHNEVCQKWAEQNQLEGRAGNINFCNGVIYSYGWWPMAKFIEPDVVLFRDESYSVSTGSHQAGVRSVIGHCEIFNVISLGLDHEANMKHYLYKLRKIANNFWNARGHYAKWSETGYVELAAEIRRYVRHFDCKNILPILFGLELSGNKAKEHQIKCMARQGVIDKRNRIKWESWKL